MIQRNRLAQCYGPNCRRRSPPLAVSASRTLQSHDMVALAIFENRSEAAKKIILVSIVCAVEGREEGLCFLLTIFDKNYEALFEPGEPRTGEMVKLLPLTK